ncbi:MAG TPA: hypothetical protein VIO60_11200 [Rectinemataceae bacterium]
MIRRLFSLIFAGASFSLILASCGIDTVLLLYPPEDFSSAGGAGILSLRHQIENYDPLEGASQSFKGYEIYYRAFDNVQTANEEAAQIAYQATLYSDRPLAFESYVSNTRSFYRMRLANLGDIPLAKMTAIEAASAKTYYVTMNAGSDWILSDDDALLSVPIFRNIAEPTRISFYKVANYRSGDRDYAGSDNPSTVYFVFIAFAYGQDRSTPGVAALFSEPFVIESGVTYSPGL